PSESDLREGWMRTPKPARRTDWGLNLIDGRVPTGSDLFLPRVPPDYEALRHPPHQIQGPARFRRQCFDPESARDRLRPRLPPPPLSASRRPYRLPSARVRSNGVRPARV